MISNIYSNWLKLHEAAILLESKLTGIPVDLVRLYRDLPSSKPNNRKNYGKSYDFMKRNHNFIANQFIMTIQFKKWGEEILAKLGILSKECKVYLQTAITASTTLLSWIVNKPAEITIRGMFPNVSDELYQKIVNGVRNGIKYLTQTQDIVTEENPDKMLTLFITELQADAPGLQKTKAMKFAQKIFAALHGNTWLSSLYDYVVQKYWTAKAIGVNVE